MKQQQNQPTAKKADQTTKGQRKTPHSNATIEVRQGNGTVLLAFDLPPSMSPVTAMSIAIRIAKQCPEGLVSLKQGSGSTVWHSKLYEVLLKARVKKAKETVPPILISVLKGTEMTCNELAEVTKLEFDVVHAALQAGALKRKTKSGNWEAPIFAYDDCIDKWIYIGQ